MLLSDLLAVLAGALHIDDVSITVTVLDPVHLASEPECFSLDPPLRFGRFHAVSTTPSSPREVDCRGQDPGS